MYFSKMATINLRQSTLATAVGNGRKDRYSGKKAKLEDPRNNMVKPNKRPALGNITNNATATATRKQPSRAAKQVQCHYVNFSSLVANLTFACSSYLFLFHARAFLKMIAVLGKVSRSN